MFILSKRNIEIVSDDESMSYFIPRDYVGEVPDWVGTTEYFGMCVKDGIIAVSESKKDKDIQKAEEKTTAKSTKKKATKSK